MKKKIYFVKVMYIIIIYNVILIGCSSNNKESKHIDLKSGKQEELVVSDNQEKEKTGPEINNGLSTKATEIPYKNIEPQIIKKDWKGYFDGFNGAAVVYDASVKRYSIYNRKLAKTRRSPCSTFKIISSLIALENGIIKPDNSIHKWSGEVFWNESWNHDINFRDAFRESCVWYFREVIDEIGKETLQEELNKLKYGNCDISDWKGKRNTNNNNRALTGFWIESSLKVSPEEQTEVMERIFGKDSVYSDKTLKELKKVMLVEEKSKKGVAIYGKTGMGKTEGIVVDAWFTGFAEKKKRKIYFCVYLGRTDNKNVSSIEAKEIAARIVTDYLDN